MVVVHQVVAVKVEKDREFRHQSRPPEEEGENHSLLECDLVEESQKVDVEVLFTNR